MLNAYEDCSYMAGIHKEDMWWVWIEAIHAESLKTVPNE